MTQKDREIQRSLSILKHAEWAPPNSKNRTPPEIVDMVLYLRSPSSVFASDEVNIQKR